MPPESTPMHWLAWAQTQGVWCLLFVGLLVLIYIGGRKGWKLMESIVVPWFLNEWAEIKGAHNDGMAALGQIGAGMADVNRKLDPMATGIQKLVERSDDEHESAGLEDRPVGAGRGGR